jgi:AcrR family transcriptional regulator
MYTVRTVSVVSSNDSSAEAAEPSEGAPDRAAVASSETRSGERRVPGADRRREIVATAVRIADSEGLEAVSMRRLAEELGVATMTSYTHVESKDELIDLMRDEVSREMLVPEPLPSEWRPALTAIARRTKDAFEAHPWALRAVARRPRGRINHMRHIEQSIQVAMMLGLERQRSGAVLTAVDDYVIGYCHRARARERMLAAGAEPTSEAARREVAAAEPSERETVPPGPAGSPDAGTASRDPAGSAGASASESGIGSPGAAPGMRSVEDVDPELAAALAAGELPLVKRAFGRRDRRHPIGVPPDSGFEPGLQWLLDGIEAEADRAAPDEATARP